MHPALIDLGIGDYLNAERIEMFGRAAIVFVVGVIIARLLAALVLKIAGRRSSPQDAMVIRRLVYYSILALVVMSCLNIMGLEIGVLLGAAGILTVALGFASQTSASNLISGLFLIAERPFVVGDVIKVEDVTGEVLTIDLLSVKLRTFDNLYVRVPNEAIIKSRVTNLTHFPIRRFDMQVGVAYREDLDRVKAVMMEVAHANIHCLIDPEPLFIVLGFGDSSLNVQFSVWAQRESWLQMRNSMHVEIKRAFDAAGIEIPFPQRTITQGSRDEPFTLSMVADQPAGGDQ